VGTILTFIFQHKICILGKNDSISGTRTECYKPISDPTFEIGSPGSGLETRIDLNRTIPEISYKVTYFWVASILDQKSVDPKSARTKVHPTQIEPIQNITYCKIWHDPNLTRPVSESNDLFTKSSVYLNTSDYIKVVTSDWVIHGSSIRSSKWNVWSLGPFFWGGQGLALACIFWNCPRI